MSIRPNAGTGDDAEREAAFLKRLESLEAKPRRRQQKATLRDLVVKYYPILKPAQERGQTYDELALIFEEELGVNISPGTLRKYMAYAKNHSGDNAALPKLSVAKPTNTRSPQVSLQVQPKSTSMPSERREMLLRNSQYDDIESEFENL
ncbi:hypothetical protein BST81_23615 [Leptolyngbya sp. 'hensonii']|uniref:hypothetical protein n=1 Tax=Leptolyngbya sp. 'hensonii' TaxID=1922337 RepID=UPI00094F51CA|nr:hypothetical protein [Leptolyngbya sp. 'hensonii']OLP15918.1 hypothetical protein BST81_23615 [Leptolyngbya sp. 'hensonii']